MDKEKIKKVLFVCTGNTCRSPMCEGVFNSISLNRAVSRSAGLSVCDDKIAYNSYMVLLENNIDITHIVPTQITMQMIEDYDFVLTMTKEHIKYLPKSNNVYSIDEFVGLGDISDPYGKDIEVYRTTFNQIKEICKKVLDKVLNT